MAHLAELKKYGVTCRMGDFMNEAVLLERIQG